MSSCKNPDCNLECHKNHQHCVLHCAKSSYSKEFPTGILIDFYQAFLALAARELNKGNQGNYSGMQINELIEGKQQIMGTHGLFEGINFPGREGRDFFDYSKILNLFESIQFIRCEFSAYYLDLPDTTKVFFDECKFNEYYLVENYQTSNGINCYYQQCLFTQSVDVNKFTSHRLNVSLFDNCQFLEQLIIEKSDIKGFVFSEGSELPPNLKRKLLKELIVTNSKITGPLNIQDFKINNIRISHSSFESRTNIKNLVAGDIAISQSDFQSHFTFSKNTLKKILIKDSEFHSSFNIHDSIFSDRAPTKIEYTTHKDIVNLKNSKFLGGLDIERISCNTPINFLGSKTEFDGTNRETFRIIKNSFDAVGNNIEANHYFSEEMKKLRQETKFREDKQKWLLLNLNYLISNFGQSYVRPLSILFGFLLLHLLINTGHERELLYSIYPPANSTITFLSNGLNRIAINFLPFKNFLQEGREFLSLIFYTVYVSLVWQAVVAIKRHTRR